MTDKPDNAALSRINELVAEEKALREQLQHGKISESEENKRLRQLEIELDQCWDLLRQRRAHIVQSCHNDWCGAKIRFFADKS